MKKSNVIQRSDLARSKKACHQIEDEIWARMRGRSITEDSSARAVATAVEGMRRETCPDWVEREAWDRILESFLTWSQTYNNLVLFWQLRKKPEERPSDIPGALVDLAPLDDSAREEQLTQEEWNTI